MNDRGLDSQEGVFSEAACGVLGEALSSSSLRRSRAGARHLMSYPLVAALAADARLLEIARHWIGMAAAL